MADIDLLTEMYTDVKYIKDALTMHIAKDEKIQQEFLRPLWEESQQRKGAAKLAGLMYIGLSGAVAAAVSYFLPSHGK